MSNTTTANKHPTWFWMVAILALLWNLIGVFAFVMQVNMSPGALAELPEAQRGLYESQPTWVTAAFAVAVFAGALGSLMLVLSKKLAAPLLELSLLAILVQMTYMFFLSDTFAIMGSGAMAMPIAIIVIAVLLVWFARTSITRRWIT